jgi:hypothetical protein
MNTPTHLLVGAGLFARPGQRARNTAALAGALLPDLAIFVLWGWARLAGYSEAAVWSQLYPSQIWQTAVTVGNAAPLYALVGLAGWMLGRPVLWVFALAALTHVALDLPVHVSDAHAHFWPLTDWRFESSVSYWNDAHHAQWVQAGEVAFALALTVLLWRRFSGWPVRAVLAASLLLYAAVPAYFVWTLSG